MLHQWVNDFFASADSLDVERFCASLPHDIVWRFANFPAAHGVVEVRAQYEAVVQILRTMKHDIIGVWDAGDVVAAETRVYYTDIHGREFECPGCDLFFLKNGELSEVRIFVDNHFLFTPPSEQEPINVGEGAA